MPRRTKPRKPPGETRRAVAELRSQGFSYTEIARRLGIAKSVVAYHARRIGVPADERCARRYDWNAIQAAHDAGLSVRECARRFGFNLASWHKAVLRGDVVARPSAIPLDELLVANRRTHTNRCHLKRRLFAAGLKVNRCERCGITEWQGEKLNMHLHHVNGDGRDNRLENLELLCPNCHSLTDTYGGRNGHRRKHAPQEPA